MNTERMFRVVLMDLTSAQIKLENDLEMAINSDEKLEIKSIRIRQILSEITTIENSINKFTSMFQSTNNNEVKNNQND